MLRRRDWFRRKGATIGWPSLLPEIIVVGPYNLVDAPQTIGFGENTVFVTEDSRLLPYLGAWRRAPIHFDVNVQIGLNTVICPGVSIGSYSTIGAATLIDRDVPEFTVVVGSPFRVAGNFKKQLRRRIDELTEHPERYTEEFPFFGTAMPFDDMPLRSETWCRPDTGETMSNRIRDFIRGSAEGIWEALQEPDEFRASEQRIRIMRKQGYAIGDHCYIDRRASIDYRSHQVSIGSHCSIGALVTIVTHDGFCANFTGRIRSQPIRILDGCSIGASAVILPGVTIGPASVVEPGSVVSNDVPPYTVVAGTPAKPVATIWDWLAERRSEAEAHPDQFVAEPRMRPYPVPPRESIPPDELPRVDADRPRARTRA